MPKLKAASRKRMKPKSFAIPSERKYPIHDRAHARAALSRVAQHGTSQQQAKVKAAVRRKFPSINVSG